MSGDNLIAQKAQEAKSEANKELLNLLQKPEDLLKIKALKQEYIQKNQANRQQLSSSIQQYVESSKQGLDLLERSTHTIDKLQKGFDEISYLCQVCTTLIENNEQVSSLSRIRCNVKRTLSHVEDILQLPSLTDQTEKMLKKDEQLLEAYRSVIILESTSQSIRESVQKGNPKLMQLASMKKLWTRVEAIIEQFENKLFRKFKDITTVSQQRPEILVMALKIIEIQERVDRQIKVKPKRYKDRCLDVAIEAIHENFEDVFEKIRNLNDITEDQTEALQNELKAENQGNIEASLNQIQDFFDHLHIIRDTVTLIFPSDYNIFTVLQGFYHFDYAKFLDYLGMKVKLLADADILCILEFVKNYQELLLDVGVEEDKIYFPRKAVIPDAEPGLNVLQQSYTTQFKETLKTQIQRLLEYDIKERNYDIAQKQYISKGVFEVFILINEAYMVLQNKLPSDLQQQAITIIINLLEDVYDVLQQAYKDSTLPVELQIALGNGCVTCAQKSEDLEQQLQQNLPREQQKTLTPLWEQIRVNFYDLANDYLQNIIDRLFKIQEIVQNFKKFFNTPAWSNGTVQDDVLSQLDEEITEQFQHMSEYLQITFFNTFAQQLATLYFNSLLQLNPWPKLDVDTVDRFQQDVEIFKQFIGDVVGDESKAEDIMGPAQNVISLTRASDLDSVEDYYGQLIMVSKSANPSFVSAIFYARADINKAVVNEILKLCKQLYATRKEDPMDQSKSTLSKFSIQSL